MLSLLALPIAYLIGSIPFGYLIVKLTSGGDIRQTGSGGTGATNVSRRAGKLAGIATLILDALKGAVAVFVAAKWCEQFQPNWFIADWILSGSAVAVIVGHIFPVWLRFRGGKGVATGAGVFFMLHPPAVLFAGVVFVIIVLFTRYVSLGSIVGALVIPLSVWLMHVFVQRDLSLMPVLTAAIVGALLIVFAHRANIARLMNGTEPKFS
ncbi:MAG TPA: glycerol-3-phosphate 1-O-acyltransferase PlsY [Pyrinomonadaceae bacterium]|nr:glycerol-3-phosphate 1-O-acyltransferase PlsY [Pyrinomonadaceae bacterium]